MKQPQPSIRVNIRIDGEPKAVAIVIAALRTLLGEPAQLGAPQLSQRRRYAGTALARGSADAYQLAERAATIADLEKSTAQAPKEHQ